MKAYIVYESSDTIGRISNAALYLSYTLAMGEFRRRVISLAKDVAAINHDITFRQALEMMDYVSVNGVTPPPTDERSYVSVDRNDHHIYLEPVATGCGPETEVKYLYVKFTSEYEHEPFEFFSSAGLARARLTEEIMRATGTKTREDALNAMNEYMCPIFEDGRWIYTADEPFPTDGITELESGLYTDANEHSRSELYPGEDLWNVFSEPIYAEADHFIIAPLINVDRNRTVTLVTDDGVHVIKAKRCDNRRCVLNSHGYCLRELTQRGQRILCS